MSNTTAPRREDFRFLDRLRVRWAEVDLQRIVFNGHYLMYFDTAVAGYWRALAMPYHETMEHLQGDLYVRKATLEYLASARYDEQLETGIRCGRIGNSSMVFTAAVFRAQQCLVHGELLYVFADPATQTSKPVPQPLRELLHGFEAGQPMLRVELGDWATLGPAARTLRDAVFVQEQGIRADLVCDDADAGALHAVAFNRFGLPVASGRLVDAGNGVAQLGRMATVQALRGSGLGRQVFDALVQAARHAGQQSLRLHAQTSAVPFYRRAGCTAEGEVFEVVGIPHQTMRLAL